MSSPPPPGKPRPPLILAFGAVEVRFEWRGDRWGHAIRFDETVDRPDGSGWRSVEGPLPHGDDRWPASPVLVEIHAQGGPDGVAVIGLGLAGRSHFSASVGPDPRAPGSIRFDLAARIHAHPGSLGSTYRREGTDATTLRVEPLPVADAPLPRTVEWSYRIGPTGIEPLSGARLGVAPLGLA